VNDDAAEFVRHQASVTECVVSLETHKAAALGLHRPYQLAKNRGLGLKVRAERTGVSAPVAIDAVLITNRLWAAESANVGVTDADSLEMLGQGGLREALLA